MCPEKLVNVFVYGTLKQGGYLNMGEELASIEDSVKGAMYSAGPFPLGVLGGDDLIHGEVHIYPEKYLRRLDRMESEGVLYKRVEVITEGGRPCYFYEYMHQIPTSCPKIEGGVWKNEQ